MNELKKTQGQEANHSGRSLERDIESEFNSRGIRSVKHIVSKGNIDIFDARYLVKRVPQRNWWDGHSWSEFVYYSPTLAVRIECKWQEQAGSIDEKAVSLFENALRAPEPVVWLVLGGKGMRRGILDYLWKRARAEQSKIIRVLTPADTKAAIKLLVESDDVGAAAASPLPLFAEMVALKA